jgi:hypothetical protein
MLTSGCQSSTGSQVGKASERASRLPVAGISCINPRAPALEVAAGLNSDSCRISAATNAGSMRWAAASARIASAWMTG